MCLWALVRYREWSLRLADPRFRGLARKAFALVSDHRQDLSRVFARGMESGIRVTTDPGCSSEPGAGCRTG